MSRTRLTDVTLICIDCVQYGYAVEALQKSLEQIEPDRAVFLTDIQFDVAGVETVIIPRINNIQEYSRFMIKELYKYFDTTHVLIIQADGHVLDGSVWNDSWKWFDYIGSPWLETDGYNVGNGGFSLRSRRLCTALLSAEIKPLHPEDSVICRIYRPLLERWELKFAPEEVADVFGFELREPKQSTFGFHGYFHQPFKPTVVLKRSGALGDIISMEPLMHELYLRGNNVVLDVPAHLFDVFSNHWYPIKHISQFDAGRISARYVDLDMVYEVKPQQLHLKSYFEALGLEPKDGYRNSKLTVGEQMRPLFDRYVVLHIDQRDTLPRNVYGVEWERVVTAFNDKGYNVIQIGNQQREVVALNINTPTVGFLKWVIAGASYFIGVDSGPAQIAVACGVPSAIFFGSVDSSLIYPDLKNIDIIERKDVCRFPKCWHTKPSTAGQVCAELDKVNDSDIPPCTLFDTQIVIDTINQKLK